MPNDSFFSFTDYSADLQQGRAVFRYDLVRGKSSYHFEDTLTFSPSSISNAARKDTVTLENILRSLHLALGISYWKTFAPSEIRTPYYSLSKYQAQFWNTVYTKGLGEFFYTNHIDYRGLIQFPFRDTPTQPMVSHVFSDRSLVFLGGGKDSIVSAELLKKSGKPFDFFVMNPTDIHRKTAGIANVPIVEVIRTIDPALFALNKEPGVYNGHVPVSSIFAFLGVIAAFLYDYRSVIVSNERSASYGNVNYLGEEINHQWSKSFEFETMFRSYVSEFLVNGITYFSLLRPLTELMITKLFTAYPRYYPVFTSCNKAFRISEDRPSGNWCGHCPKCAFVFLLLRAYLPEQEVTAIFHKNLFGDSELLPLYEELCGLRGIKPFECVGTPEESVAAFLRIKKAGTASSEGIVPSILKSIENKSMPPGSEMALYGLSSDHNIPQDFLKVVEQL